MAVFFLFTMVCLCATETKEKVTVEEIVEILKEKGIVTDEQYEGLMKKANLKGYGRSGLQ